MPLLRATGSREQSLWIQRRGRVLVAVPTAAQTVGRRGTGTTDDGASRKCPTARGWARASLLARDATSKLFSCGSAVVAATTDETMPRRPHEQKPRRSWRSQCRDYGAPRCPRPRRFVRGCTLLHQRLWIQRRGLVLVAVSIAAQTVGRHDAGAMDDGASRKCPTARGWARASLLARDTTLMRSAAAVATRNGTTRPRIRRRHATTCADAEHAKKRR